jgi:uncharacterized protein (DUF1778 family)
MTINSTERIIKKNTQLRLSKKDARCFFEVLENPPEPNAKLISAVKKYRAHITYQPLNHKERP